jgi:disulfide bond formation protein DsbB
MEYVKPIWDFVYKNWLIILIVWLGAVIYVYRWTEDARPEGHIVKKYKKHIKFWLLFLLPFGDWWKKYVDSQDIQAWENWKKRNRMLSIIMHMPFLIIFLFWLALVISLLIKLLIA